MVVTLTVATTEEYPFSQLLGWFSSSWTISPALCRKDHYQCHSVASYQVAALSTCSSLCTGLRKERWAANGPLSILSSSIAWRALICWKEKQCGSFPQTWMAKTIHPHHLPFFLMEWLVLPLLFVMPLDISNGGKEGFILVRVLFNLFFSCMLNHALKNLDRGIYISDTTRRLHVRPTLANLEDLNTEKTDDRNTIHQWLPPDGTHRSGPPVHC